MEKNTDLVQYTQYYLSFAFLIIIGISSAYFYFHWYLKKDITCVKFNTNTQTTIYKTNNWEVSKK